MNPSGPNNVRQITGITMPSRAAIWLLRSAIYPLVEEHHHEQSGEDEFESVGVQRGEPLPQQAAERRAEHPVELVEQGDEAVEPTMVHALRDLRAGVHREGLVAQAVDEIELLHSHVPVFAEHGDAVEDVAGADHDRQQEHRDGVERGEQQVDGDEFHGTGEDERAHAHGPYEGEALGAHEHTV